MLWSKVKVTNEMLTTVKHLILSLKKTITYTFLTHAATHQLYYYHQLKIVGKNLLY